MARIVLLVLLVAGVTIFAAHASDAASDAASVQPAGEELTLDKAARAKKDAGYPYGGAGSYNTGYSYNRGYNAYPTAPGYNGYNTGYTQDWARSYSTPYVDPRYQYQQPGFYPTATADPRYSNYYNRGYNTAGYPGYTAGYGGYDARTATGYGGYSSGYGGSRYPYEDRFYSNYPYNNNYNRYPNDYNRRTNYDSRYPAYQAGYSGYPASAVGGYNNYNTGYNYNSGYGSYPNYPVTQEYYYTPAASNNVYNTGYNSRYLKKRDGKDPAVAASAEAPVVGSGPTPATPVA